MLACTVALAACGGDAAGGDDGGAGGQDAGFDPGPWSSLAERPCPADSGLSYESFGEPFFLDYCQGCHGSARSEGERQGAPIGVYFDEVEDVRLAADLIWLMAADQNRRMPPLGGPADETRAQLGAWLACGAPTRDEL
jgi:hypothetical protein